MPGPCSCPGSDRGCSPHPSRRRRQQCPGLGAHHRLGKFPAASGARMSQPVLFCGLRAHPAGIRAAARAVGTHGAPVSCHLGQAGLLLAEEGEDKHRLCAPLEGLDQAETECWPQLQGRGTECSLGRAEMLSRAEPSLPRPSCPLCSPRRTASPSNHSSMPVPVWHVPCSLGTDLAEPHPCITTLPWKNFIK